MMNLSNPLFLLLLPLLGLLAWWRERPGSAAMAKIPFPEGTLLASMPGTWRTRFAYLPRLLVYIGLALAIFALARPRSLLKGEEAKARGIDIMLVLDTSGSMRALDFNPQNRMDVAKKSTRTFITRRQVDRLGLVVFAGASLLQCPLTLDYAALLSFLDQVDVGMTQTENTAIGTAIATAANRLKKSTAKSRVMILVTDGRSNAGEIDPLTAAKAAEGVGVRIYTIGVGIRGQSMIPVETVWGRQVVPIKEDLDEPGLEQIARATGGRYFRASSPKQFDEIFKEIDGLEKSEILGPTPQAYQDRYFPWLMLAMVFLTAGFGLQKTLWRSLP